MFGLVPFDRRHKGMQNQQNNMFDLNGIMESFFNDSVFPSFYCNSSQMKVDISETDEAYLLDADLPGVSKDQIRLDIDDDRLTIRVEQDEEHEEKNQNYIRRERRQSTMARSFGLSDVDQEKIEAEMKDGVLHIRLPKLPESKQRSRSVEIK